ncbi:hypothetical protein ABAC402_19485, partial [Asticcacaulis sp. AC402]
DSAGDVLTELANGGADEVQASLSYTLAEDLENLLLTGSGDLNGTGNTSDNRLTGNTGSNRLTGLGGNDTLTGEDGADLL